MPTRRSSRSRTRPTPQQANHYQERMLQHFAAIVIGGGLVIGLVVWVISLVPIWAWIALCTLAILGIIGMVIYQRHRYLARQQGEEILPVPAAVVKRRKQQVQETDETPKERTPYLQGYRPIVSIQSKEAITLGNLLELLPPDFEKVCGALLIRMGYAFVEHTGKPNDKGADLWAVSPENEITIAQCKRHGRGIAATAQEYERLLGSMVENNATVGIFFTTSHFTSEVIQRSKKRTNIILYDGEQIIKLMQQVGMTQANLSNPSMWLSPLPTNADTNA